MSKEKQIDEMLNEICTNCSYLLVCEDERLKQVCRFAKVINVLYDAGYRKQIKGEWISVDERLPEVNTKVLGYSRILADICCYHIAKGATEIQWWTEDNGWYRASELAVTHWMPLPEPPKGE